LVILRGEIDAESKARRTCNRKKLVLKLVDGEKMCGGVFVRLSIVLLIM
jgi:hypothetical protein